MLFFAADVVAVPHWQAQVDRAAAIFRIRRAPAVRSDVSRRAAGRADCAFLQQLFRESLRGESRGDRGADRRGKGLLRLPVSSAGIPQATRRG